LLAVRCSSVALSTARDSGGDTPMIRNTVLLTLLGLALPLATFASSSVDLPTAAAHFPAVAVRVRSQGPTPA
jgi:hypothetical protein